MLWNGPKLTECRLLSVAVRVVIVPPPSDAKSERCNIFNAANYAVQLQLKVAN
jgi:hypothetical protein